MAWKTITLDAAKQHALWDKSSFFEQVIIVCMIGSGLQIINIAQLVQDHNYEPLYLLCIPYIGFIIRLSLLKGKKEPSTLKHFFTALWVFIGVTYLLSTMVLANEVYLIIKIIGHSIFFGVLWTIVLSIYAFINQTYRLQYKYQIKYDGEISTTIKAGVKAVRDTGNVVNKGLDDLSAYMKTKKIENSIKFSEKWQKEADKHGMTIDEYLTYIEEQAKKVREQLK